MGKMQNNLSMAFKVLGCSVNSTKTPCPTRDTIKVSPHYEQVLAVYRSLGGIMNDIPANLRTWDMIVDGIAVELDEMLHFNRYRQITLLSTAYNALPHFPLLEYRQYCLERELGCIKAGSYGGKWSNNSCEMQFGRASDTGSFDGNGSPRWKQRAFYDFIKDLSPLLIGVSLVRISIWDKVNVEGAYALIKDLLSKPVDEIAGQAILELVERRKPV